MEAIVVREFVKSYYSLETESGPLPQLPLEPDTPHVLIRITHAGVNFVDLLYARGKHQNNRRHVVPPFTLGLEFAGLVQDATSGSSFQAGNRVFGATLGCFATHLVAKESEIRKVPEAWTLRGAAGMAATAPVSYGAMVGLAQLKRGETVLVHAAAGGLGGMAVQIARAVGARVIGTVGSNAKREVAKRVLSLAEDNIVDYSIEGWEQKVLDATGGNGVDVVFDVVGLVEKSIKVCRYGGRIIIMGFAGREGNLESIRANRILLKGISVLGYRFEESERHNPGQHDIIWKAVNQLVAKGQLKPVIFDESFNGLSSVPQALQAMADRKVWGKAIIDIAPELDGGAAKARI